MTVDTDTAKVSQRVNRANAVRKANGACPHCGTREQWRRIASLWKAAFVMQDAEIGDIAWETEQAIAGKERAET